MNSQEQPFKSRPPFGYQLNVTLKAGQDWTKPANVIIAEMRVKTSGTVKTTTRQGRTAKSFAADYDIFGIDIETIHADTTSSTLFKNQITVYGDFIKDVQ